MRARRGGGYGRVWHARRVRVAGYFAFWKVAVIGAGRASRRPLDTRDEGAVGRTVRFAGIATTIVMLLLMWPPISHNWQQGRIGQLAILFTLVPQALVIAIPMGMAVGILVGLRGRVATRRVKRLITALGLASGTTCCCTPLAPRGAPMACRRRPPPGRLI